LNGSFFVLAEEVAKWENQRERMDGREYAMEVENEMVVHQPDKTVRLEGEGKRMRQTAEQSFAKLPNRTSPNCRTALLSHGQPLGFPVQ
jgi:hypothetical protein